MPTFISPSGNPEIWNEKPEDYLTPEEWDAAHQPPPPPEPTPEELRAAQIAQIKAALVTIDLASIRPLRAIADESDMPEDHEKISELDSQATTLRDELAALTADETASTENQ